jgi:Flp pilus assembly protein TadD
MTYVYRGNVYLLQGRPADAKAQFQRALQLEPANSAAIQAIASLGRQ